MTNTTPDMDLVLPDVIMTSGPGYAYLINAAMYLIDSHDHSSGKGVQVTPAGLNISSDLSFVQNNATNLRSARLYNNSSFTAGANDKTCLYSLNNELYYIDGSGNKVQITLNGSLDLSSGVAALTIKDSNLIIENASDITKKFSFSAANLTTGTTYTFSLPASSGNDTFVLDAATQILTNKTLGSTNTLTGALIASFTSDGSDTIIVPTGSSDTVALLAKTQTLTNKTLTSPAISAPTITGAGTITSATDFVDTSDATKAISFSISGNTSGKVLTIASQQSNSETLSIPNISSADTIATLASSQTFTGTQTIQALRLSTSPTINYVWTCTNSSTGAGSWQATPSAVAATSTTAGTITREATWTSYTPTVSGFGTVSSNSSFYKVLGDTLFVKGSFTSGSTAATLGSIGIPSGFTISSSHLSLNNNTSNPGNIVGFFCANQSAANSEVNLLTAPSTTTSAVYIGGGLVSTTPLTPEPSTQSRINSTSVCVFQFEVPIV